LFGADCDLIGLIDLMSLTIDLDVVVNIVLDLDLDLDVDVTDFILSLEGSGFDAIGFWRFRRRPDQCHSIIFQ
jgi:hypothetical protein